MRTHSNTAIPYATATFSDCLIPNCGISNAQSTCASTSFAIPVISFPITSASGKSPFVSDVCLRLSVVNSHAAIFTPFDFSVSITSTAEGRYSHSTLSVEPSAVLVISGRGGYGVYPQRNNFEISAPSEVRKMEPTLYVLRTLSTMTKIGCRGLDAISSNDVRMIS